MEPRIGLKVRRIDAVLVAEQAIPSSFLLSHVLGYHCCLGVYHFASPKQLLPLQKDKKINLFIASTLTAYSHPRIKAIHPRAIYAGQTFGEA